MTWPQYLRRECVFRGAFIGLSRQAAEVLLVLLVRKPRPASSALLVDVLFGDDPEGGPDRADHSVWMAVAQLRAKMPGAIGGRYGFGWHINEERMA